MALKVKNKNDKRYQKSESRLRSAFLTEVNLKRNPFTIQSGNISRRAGLNSTTFHRHYHHTNIGLHDLANNIQKDFLKDYRLTLRRIFNHSHSTAELARGTFVYIRHHRQLVVTAINLGYTTIFEQMGKTFWQYAKSTTNYRHGMNRIQTTYTYEFIGIVLCWIR